MGSVVMPEIRRYDYDMRLAAGALAASGTLGILIPPSLIFIFYGVMTETSIGALFIAGIVPGVLTLLMFSGIILVRCVVNPKLGPKGPRASWRERFRAIGLFAPVFALFALAIGGIYAGIFTPTEAAGVGCVGVMITALVQRKLTWSRISAALHSTALISVMIFAIILGGYSVARFLAVTGLTEDAVALLVRLDLSEGMFLFVLVIVYLVLGSMLDVFGMLVLTIPILLPIVTSYGFDRVWFGVFVTIMAELALVTPPIGANVFVMRRVAPDVPMGDIFLGVLPFVVGELVLVALLVVFPQIALWLPGMMN
jgi:tripartite ATP-independent transporter DctM subunit